MQKLLELIDELDNGTVGSGDGYLHEEIFDFVFGAIVPALQQRDEVWLVLSKETKDKYELNGNLKLNARNCKMYNYDSESRTISVDISVGGIPGIYEFTPGEYVAAFTESSAGFVDIAHIVIQDFTAQVSLAYLDLLGADISDPYNTEDETVEELIQGNSKTSKTSKLDKVQEVKGNVVTVDFGKPRT